MKNYDTLNLTALRSNVVEMTYSVSGVAFRDDSIIWQCGDPQLVVPTRSTSKPFMVQPLIEALNKRGLSLSNKQLSVIASSHNGEKAHRDVVSSILDLASCTVSDLVCGTHLPFYESQYEEFFCVSDLKERQLFHNCSGKHAGMLLLCKLTNQLTTGYYESVHPIQQAITKSAKMFLTNSSEDVFTIGVDGCGVPTYNTKLIQLAKAYAEFGHSFESQIIRNAMLIEPFYVAGTQRIDTIITQLTGYIAKSGSDGLFCVSCPKERIGIALKIESGSEDASESAIVEVLNRLGLISKEVFKELHEFWHHPIYTSTKVKIGNYQYN